MEYDNEGMTIGRVIMMGRMMFAMMMIRWMPMEMMIIGRMMIK